MVQRCLFPPLSPPLSPAFGTCASLGTAAAGAGGSPFARVPHLPPPTAAEAAVARARAIALRHREARICGWVARLLWVGLHAVIIAITYAANAAVAARLRHDIRYTLSLSAMLALNVVLYVSLCALDPGFIPKTAARLGSGVQQRRQENSAVQLAHRRHPSTRGGKAGAALHGNGTDSGLLPNRAPAPDRHLCCSAAVPLPGSFAGTALEAGSRLSSQSNAMPASSNAFVSVGDDPGSLQGLGGAPPAGSLESGSITAATPVLEHALSRCVGASAVSQPMNGIPTGGLDRNSITAARHLPDQAEQTCMEAVSLPQSSMPAAGWMGQVLSTPAAVIDTDDLEEQALLSTPGRENSQVAGGESPWWCQPCGVLLPPRAKHCHDCGRCVREFDHHCAWLGTCVGAGNRCRFWWFLLVQTALLAWGTAETAVAVPRQGFGSHIAHPVTAALLLWATFTCSLLLLVTAFLLLFNGYLLAAGMTMHEYMRGRAAQRAGELERGSKAQQAERVSCVRQVLKNLRVSCCPWGE